MDGGVARVSFEWLGSRLGWLGRLGPVVRLGWTRARLSSLGLSLVEKWAKGLRDGLRRTIAGLDGLGVEMRRGGGYL